MTDDLDFYDLLRVDEEASEEEIREGFRQQVREYHPDLNDDPRAPAQFSALKKAYDTLADPKERDAYDRLGHEEYVSNRISGLPSPDAWMVEDEDGGTSQEPDSDDEDEPDESAGRDRSSRSDRTTTSASATSRSTSGRSTAETPGSTGASRTDVTGSSTTAETAQESTRTTRTTSKQSSSSSTETTEEPSHEATERAVDPTNGGGHSGTGAGTARGPGMGTSTTDVDPDRTESAAESSAESESSSIGRSVRSGLEDAFGAAIGWPLILTADALFFVSLGLYAATNAEGLNALLDRLAAAGADPGAIQSALETKPQGFESLASFLGTELNASPVVGTVVLVGMAFLPSVYFFMVRWTRRNRLPWQPTYLYVVGALSPIVALVASVSADLPGVYVEVVGFFLVPVATIFSMLFFAQVKPRIARLYRRWRYRIGS